MNFFQDTKNKCKLLKESNLLTEDAILKAQQNLSDLLDSVIQKLSALPETTDGLKETKQGLLNVFKNLERASDELGAKAGDEPGGFAKFMGMVKRSDPKQQKQDEAAAQISYIITHVEMNMAMFETVISGIAEWMNQVGIKDEEIQFLESLPNLLNQASAEKEKTDSPEGSTETKAEAFNLIHRNSLLNLLLEGEGGYKASLENILESAEKIRINSFLSDHDFTGMGDLPHRPSVMINFALNQAKLFENDDQKKKDLEKLSKRFEKAEQSAKRSIPGLKQEMAKSAKEKQKELGKMVSDMGDLLLPEELDATTMSPEVLLGDDGAGGILTLGWNEFKEFAAPIKKEVIDKSEGILQKMQGETEVSPEAQGLIDAGEPYMKAMANNEVFKDLSEKDRAVLAIVMAASQATPEEIFKESFLHHRGLSLLLEDKRVIDALKLVKDYKWDMSPEAQQKVFDYLDAGELLGGSSESGELNLDVKSQEYTDALAIALAALAPAIEPDKLDSTPINVGNKKTNKQVEFEFTSPEKHLDFFKELGLENPESIISDLANVKKINPADLQAANLGPGGEDALVFTDDEAEPELQDNPAPMEFTELLQAILDEEQKWIDAKIPGATDGFVIEIAGKDIPIRKVFPVIIEGDNEKAAPFIKILKKAFGKEYEKKLTGILEDFKVQLEDAKTQKLIDDLANASPEEVEKKVDNVPEDQVDNAVTIGTGKPDANPGQLKGFVDAMGGGDNESDSPSKTIKKKSIEKFLKNVDGLKKAKATNKVISAYLDAHPNVTLESALSKKSMANFLFEGSDEIEDIVSWAENNWKKAKIDKDDLKRVLKNLKDEDVVKFLADEAGIEVEAESESGPPAFIKKSKFKDFHQAFSSAAEDEALKVAINKSFLDKKKSDGSQDLRNAINVGADAAGIPKPVFQETIERWRKLAGIIKD